jgi:hypothetical protein
MLKGDWILGDRTTKRQKVQRMVEIGLVLNWRMGRRIDELWRN